MYLTTTEGHSQLFILTFNDRRVVIILEIDVVKRAEEVAGRIGDPTPYTEGKNNAFLFVYWFKKKKKKVDLKIW